MNPGGLRTWNDERDAELRRLWAWGWTSGKIAQRFGVSRNSVIGRVHRLKLAKRVNPCGKGRPLSMTPDAVRMRAERKKAKMGREEACAARKARRKAARPSPPPKAPPEPKPVREPSRRLSSDVRTCQWTDSNHAPWVFCGKPAAYGSSWCAEHYHRVFQQRKLGE